VDMKAPVLFVAHLDTVQKLMDPRSIRIDDNRIHATGLDDRLGCYLAFRLNLLGIRGDVLLCDHEETNETTAKYFETDKHYNWVAEFDREGTQAVTYGDDSILFLKTLKKCGFKLNRGVGSDISELTLPNDPCMINIGVGYEKPHSLDSYLDISNLVSNVRKFSKFYRKYSSTSYIIE